MKNLSVIPIVALSFLIASCGNQGSNEMNENTYEEHQQGNDHEGHDHGTAEAEMDMAGPMSVFFVNLKDGDKVASPFTVQMGVEGMDIEPAGEVIEGTGHHHIIINGPYIEEGTVVPADEQHIHFGKGQTSTELELEPGMYKLTMQFADGLHQSYGESMSASIEIEVISPE